MDKIEYILIPVPMDITPQRGPYAVNTHTDMTRCMKFSPVHDANIMSAAKQLNIPMTTFIRWCAIYGAEAVLKGDRYEQPNEGKEG
jgi:hypothetical protein